MLPSAYQEVEYIESNGTQWINTGLNGTKLYRLDIQFNAANARQLFGAGPTGHEYIEVSLYNTWSSVGFPTGNTPLLRNKVWLDVGTISDQLVNKWVEDAMPDQGSSNNWQNTITKNIELFCLSNTNHMYNWSAKLYGFQAFTSNQNRTLEADMHPCYRVADGAIGLYDVVRGGFYTNGGTGVFAKGPDIYPEPVVHIDSHNYAIINKEDIIDYRNLFNEELYKNLSNDYEYLTNSYKCKSIQLTPNTTYTISQRAGVTSSILLLLHNNEQVYASGFFDCRKVSDVKTYTTDDSGKLYIGVSGSVTQADFDARLIACKIQIELGSTQSEYVPFEWKKGKNLLARPFYGDSGSGVENYTRDGVTYNVAEDGRIRAVGTTTRGTNYYFIYNKRFPAGEYMVSFVGKCPGLNFIVYDGDNREYLARIYNSSVDRHVRFTLTTETTILVYFNQGSTSVNVDVDGYPMLEEGTTASPYEPYNQKALIKSLSADFPLQQDLHGYDHPWGPGMGKNLLKVDESQMSGTINNYYYKQFTTSQGFINQVTIKPFRSYILSLNIESDIEPFKISVGLGNGTYSIDIKTVDNLTSGTVIIPFTILNASIIDTYGSTFAFRAPRYDSTVTAHYKISQVQLEEDDGSGDPTPYEPYSNVCPITTYSGLDFDVVKAKYKNLLNIQNKTYTNCGVVKECNHRTQTVSIRGTATVAGGRLEWFSDENILLTPGVYRLNTYAVSGTKKGKYWVSEANSPNTALHMDGGAFNIGSDVIVNVGVNVEIGTDYNETVALLLEKDPGSSAPDYEPYAPSIYKHYSDIFSTPIAKGSFEHVSGKLTGLYKKVVFDGSENWTIQPGSNAAMLSNALPGIKANSTPISNYVRYTTSSTDSRKLGYFTFSGTRITLGNMRYINTLTAYQFWADAAAVKAYLAANPLEIAYELEAPISETITTDFIQLYDGKNVLSSDRDLKVTFFDGTEMIGKKFTILLISRYSTMPVHVETDSRFGPNLILPRTKPTHTRDNGWELMFLSKDTELPPGCVCEFDTIGGVIEVPVENSKCELPDSILEDLQANGVTGHVCAIGLNAKYVILDFNLEVVNRFWPYNV